MRLSLPVALIALLTTVLAETSNQDQTQRQHQRPFTATHAQQSSRLSYSSQPSTTSTTLVDALSADGNYTRLLQLLQKARLIPTLNTLNDTTLFAPTNDAIEKDALFSMESEVEDDDYHHYAFEADDSLSNSEPPKDNINEKLRQQLLYHLLRTRLQEPPKELKIHKTYLYPRPISLDSPSTPPWIPVPGGTLGGEPQRIRVSAGDEKTYVATDYEGKGGIEIIRPLVNVDNGVLIGIADVIPPPQNLLDLVDSYEQLSYFKKILSDKLRMELQEGSALTLFLPQTSAWESLHEVKRLYLESEFSDDDVRKIVNMHAVKAGKKDKTPVRWSDTWANNTNLTTVFGDELNVIISPESKTTISGAELLHPDIYASNGVLHLVSSLLIPKDALTLTAEKYLLALNCTNFVTLLRSVSLSSLVNDTTASYTILAPRNDVLTLHSGQTPFPPDGSPDLARYLKYHFLPGKWTRNNLRDGMLVETALDEDGLSGSLQVLSVGVTPETKALSFGGAGVIGENPIEVDNTIIYFITKPLTPPEDVWKTALPSLQFSTFIATVFSTSLAERLKTEPATTFFIPQNKAFERLGLVTKYLLGASNSAKRDLEQVILHHVVDGIEYSRALLKGTQKTYPTLEGSDLHAARPEDGALHIFPSGGWSNLRANFVGGNTNGNGNGNGGGKKSTKSSFVHNNYLASPNSGVADLLTRTGVIHEIDAVLLPRSVDITIGKLADAADGSTMAGLMTKAGLGWILNGTKPPSDTIFEDEWSEYLRWRTPDEIDDNGGRQRRRQQRRQGVVLDDVVGWVFLCPTETAFKGVNMTRLLADTTGIKRLVAQHLIPIVVPPPKPKPSSSISAVDSSSFSSSSPSPSDIYRPIVLDDKATYSTVLSQSSLYGDITFRPVDENDKSKGYIVGIKDARGTNGANDWANVLAWGRSTVGLRNSFHFSSSSFSFANADTPSEGGVIQIDRILVPYEPKWWIEYGPPVIVLILGLVLIGSFFMGVRKLWKKDTVEATYEPIGGFAREDDD